MIKRIIFDIDNTLLPWKSEYSSCLARAFDKVNYKYDNELVEKVFKAIDNYEYEFEIYDKHKILDLMNRYTEEKLPYEVVDYYIDELSLCADKASDDMIKTLEYLSNKYELVALTNWFGYSQEKRLEKAGIRKYFQKVYGGDKSFVKPNPKIFHIAANGYKSEECLMIGDNLKQDIEGAINVGMKAIFYNPNHVESNYQSISDLKELMNILY